MKLKNVTVLTSDGRIAKFDQNCVIKQIKRDANAANIQISNEEIDKLLSKIKTQLRKLDVDQLTGSIIRGVVNDILIKNNYSNIYQYSAKCGMCAADVVNRISGIGEDIHENANEDMDNPEVIHGYFANALTKDAALQTLPMDIRKKHNETSLYIHDLNFFLTRSFCEAWDMRLFFYAGFAADGTGHTIPVAGPAMKPEVAILHSTEVIAAGGATFSGGQELLYFNTFIAPYMKDLSYEEIYQLVQMMVYQLSQSQVKGGQPAFSTLMLSPGCPNIWKDKPVVSHGQVSKTLVYGDFEKEIQMIFKAFMELFKKGDYHGRFFGFPKLDILVVKEHVDNPTYRDLWKGCFELVAINGAPYFDIQYHKDTENTIGCTNCCALKFGSGKDSDPHFSDKLTFKSGRVFSLGSMQVISLNFPQAVMKGKTYDGTLEVLKDLVEDCIKIFQIKYDWVSKAALPFARQEMVDPNNKERRLPAPYVQEDDSFIIGIVGLDNALKYLTGKSMHESEDSWMLGIQLITDIKQYIAKRKFEVGLELTLCRTPAESSAFKMARHDLTSEEFSEDAKQIVYGDIDNYNAVWYNNGCMCREGANISLFEKIKIESPFHVLTDGGNVFHCWMTEGYPDSDGLMDFAFNLFKNSTIEYMCFTKDFTICDNCYYQWPGIDTTICPKCKSDKTTSYSRVTGYYQAISNWSESKKNELAARKRYDL